MPTRTKPQPLADLRERFPEKNRAFLLIYRPPGTSVLPCARRYFLILFRVVDTAVQYLVHFSTCPAC